MDANSENYLDLPSDVNILEKSERFLNFLMTDYESNGITKQFSMIVIDNYFDKLLIT